MKKSTMWLIGGGVAAAVLGAWWYENYGPGASAGATDTTGASASSTDTTDTDTSALPSPYSDQGTGDMTDAPDYSNGDPYGAAGTYGSPNFVSPPVPVMEVRPLRVPAPRRKFKSNVHGLGRHRHRHAAYANSGYDSSGDRSDDGNFVSSGSSVYDPSSVY